MALRIFSSLMRDFEGGAVGVNVTSSVGAGPAGSTVEVDADLDSALTASPKPLRLCDILAALHVSRRVLGPICVDTGETSWHCAGRHCTMVPQLNHSQIILQVLDTKL